MEPARRFADARAMLAELRAPAVPAVDRSVVRRRGAIVALAGLLVAAVVATVAWWPAGERPSSPPAVPAPASAPVGGIEVNFISEPAEAAIQVDGEPLVDADGKAFETPCTVPSMTPGVHHVVLRHAVRGELDAGEIDFEQVREIEVSWGCPREGKGP
jgi:hypothetical protein